MWPTCYLLYEDCNPNLSIQDNTNMIKHLASYIQICGIMAGRSRGGGLTQGSTQGLTQGSVAAKPELVTPLTCPSCFLPPPSPGMLLWGFLGDYTGRKWGSRCVAMIMLSGCILLVATPAAKSAQAYFTFFMVAQTWWVRRPQPQRGPLLGACCTTPLLGPCACSCCCFPAFLQHG